jgi:serine/threonine-protein phosphatase 2A activator
VTQPGHSVMQSHVPAEEDTSIVVTASGYRTPVRKITNQAELERFVQSEACGKFVRWIKDLNETCVGLRNDAVSVDAASEPVRLLLGVLEQLEAWLSDIPPIAQPMRYGNKAYRLWHARVKERADELLRAILPEQLKDAAVELGVYLWESIGNATRIDYGTGHELAFVVLLYGCASIGFVQPSDATALALLVFRRYIALMRAVQKLYLLEPAGSHGVWSLDDYQFLPFYLGAAQLRGQDVYPPSSIRDATTVAQLKDQYLYMAAIDFINQMKTGPFGEHSPILNDISAVKTWDKVNDGMLKMFRAEVLCKFPVMQHFKFGSIVSWSPEQAPPEQPAQQQQQSLPQEPAHPSQPQPL